MQASPGSVYLLLKDKEAEKSTSVLGMIIHTSVCLVLQGELVVPIPPVKRVPRNDGQAHNYHTISREPSATFYDDDDGTDLAPLNQDEYSVLAGVRSPGARYNVFLKVGMLDWGKKLKKGDKVSVELPGAASSGGATEVFAVVQYVGEVKPLPGITFGVEIKDKDYLGWGSSDGTFQHERYFQCQDNCGMFVSLDKLSEYPFPKPPPSGSNSTSQSYPLPLWDSGRKASFDSAMVPEHLTEHRHKIGDRVVVFSKKEVAVHGVVKWVGTHSQIVKKKQVSYKVVGIETDVAVRSSEMEGLPSKGHLFVPSKGKSAVFCFEDQVMFEADFVNKSPKRPPVPERPLHSQGQRLQNEAVYDVSGPPQQAPHQEADEESSLQLARAIGMRQTEVKQQRKAMQEMERKRQLDEVHSHSGHLHHPQLDAEHHHGLNQHPQPQPYPQPHPQSQAPQPQPRHNMVYEPVGLEVGSAVQVANNDSRTGVIRWIGNFPGMQGTIAGVELDEPMEGCGDGEWGENRHFTSPPGRGFFCPLVNLRPDTRIMSQYPEGLGPAGALQVKQIQEQLTNAATHEQGLQEQLRQNQKKIDQLQLQLQQEHETSQEQLQQELQTSQDLRHQLHLEHQSNQRLHERLQQEQRSSQDLRQQLQQEQQRSRSLQERLDRSAGEMERMHPVTAVMMTAKRSEVRIEAIIGEGAWGKVERGVFRNRPVAVKSIHPAILEHDTVLQRLRREINIVAQVRHPNLVHFIAAVLDNTAQAPPMIITELLDINLRKGYEEKRVVPSHHLSILRDTAYGLHHLHSLQQPIIHRDISSPNVLLQQQPNGGWLAKVSDFGSANFAKDARTAGEGAIIYSAPETFPATVSDPDSEPPLLTTKVDVYSYGVVACELVTSQMPTSERYRAMLQEVQRKWVFMYELII